MAKQLMNPTTDFLTKIREERARLIFQLNLIDSLLRVYDRTGGAHLPRSRDPQNVLLDEEFDTMEICR